MPAAPRRPPPPELFNDASFAAPTEPVDPQQAFAMSEAMRHYVRVDIAREARSKNPRRSLADALRNREGLQLEYDADMTRTAAKAYARMGQLSQAGRQLELAMDNSATRSEHGRYAAKLQRLRGVAAQ